MSSRSGRTEREWALVSWAGARVAAVLWGAVASLPLPCCVLYRRCCDGAIHLFWMASRAGRSLHFCLLCSRCACFYLSHPAPACGAKRPGVPKAVQGDPAPARNLSSFAARCACCVILRHSVSPSLLTILSLGNAQHICSRSCMRPATALINRTQGSCNDPNEGVSVQKIHPCYDRRWGDNCDSLDIYAWRTQLFAVQPWSQ
jgi:hypothetical protein